MTKYIYLLPLCLMMLTLSSQQSPLTIESDVIKVTSFGENTSLLELLLSIEDASYQTTAEETLKTIASKYYGYSAFSALIKASNPRLSEDATLPVDSQVNLPSVVLCVHFLTVDCVKDSFDFIQSFPDSGVLINGVLSNYWTQISENIKNKFTTSTFLYPNYINFIMGYINNLPKSDLKVQITNNLPYDLTEGAVSFDFGVGGSPASVISTKTSYSYSAQRSNDLKNIQGQLSYKIADGANSVNGISFNFNIYPGDSTDTRLPNYVEIQSGSSSWFQYQGEVSDKHFISSDYEVLVTVSRNPKSLIKIVINSRSDIPSDFTMPTTPYHISPFLRMGTVLQRGSISSILRAYTNSRGTSTNQQWRFVPVENGKNQFNLLSVSVGDTLEANLISSNVVVVAANAASTLPKWDIIPVDIFTYMIRGPNNLCWEHIPTLSFLGSGPAYRNPIILEKCSVGSDSQKWYIRPYYFVDVSQSSSKGAKISFTKDTKEWTIDMTNRNVPYLVGANANNANQKIKFTQFAGQGFEIRLLGDTTANDSCWSVSNLDPRRLIGGFCSDPDRFWYIGSFGSGVTFTHIKVNLSLKKRVAPSDYDIVEMAVFDGNEDLFSWDLNFWP